MNRRVHGVEKAAANTCGWLISHPSYVLWLETKSALLWIKGKPGSGKSTMMKHILRRENPDNTIRATYFFNGRGSQLEYQLVGLYRSLLHQLLKYSENQFLQFAARYYENKQTRGEYGLAWEWEEEVLRDQLSSVLKSLGSSQLHIYIDALDESGEASAIDLGNYFDSLVKELASDEMSLHVCFSCRHYPFVATDGLTVIMEEMNRDDLQEYVTQRLLSPSHRLSDRQTLVDSLIERADGVFQWASLVVPKVLASLRRGKALSAILREIRILPVELHELYTSLLSEIVEEDQRVALSVFRWVCFSSRPLLLAELRWIIPIDDCVPSTCVKDWKNSEYFIPSNTDLASRILDITKGLVTASSLGGRPKLRRLVLSRIVQCIHQSVKDCLIDNGYLANLELSTSTMGNLRGRGNFHLAYTCIRYLCSSAIVERAQTELSEHQRREMRQSRKRHEGSKFWITEVGEPEEEEDDDKSINPIKDNLIMSFPLLSYAASEWHYHLFEAEQNGASPAQLIELLQLFKSDVRSPDFDKWIEICDILELPCLVKKGSTIIHFMAAYGHDRLATAYLSVTEEDVNTEDTCHRICLEVAIQHRQKKMIKLLLNRPTIDVNHHCGGKNTANPMALAIATKQADILEMLLDHENIDLQVPCPNGVTFFGYVSSTNHRPSLDILAPLFLDEINKPNGLSNQTPLMQAISRGADDSVQFLLALDAIDVNAQDLFERTALAKAIRCYSNSAVQMLLQHPNINVNCVDQAGRTPLLEAIGQVSKTNLKRPLDHPKLDPAVGDVALLQRYISQSDAETQRLVKPLLEKISSTE
jgi:ankyrin repeat protein